MATWNDIDAFVAYDLLGYVKMNQILENLDYILDDVMGWDGTTEQFEQLPQKAGAKIYFGRDSRDEGECLYGSGSQAIVDGLHFRVENPQVIKGQRAWVCYTTLGNTMNADGYLLSRSSEQTAFNMPYSGYVRSASVTVRRVSWSSATTLMAELWYDGAHMDDIEGGAMVFNDAGDEYGTRVETYDRSTHSFAADHQLGLYIDKSPSGTMTWTACGVIEVQFDS